MSGEYFSRKDCKVFFSIAAFSPLMFQDQIFIFLGQEWREAEPKWGFELFVFIRFSGMWIG